MVTLPRFERYGKFGEGRDPRSTWRPRPYRLERTLGQHLGSVQVVGRHEHEPAAAQHVPETPTPTDQQTQNQHASSPTRERQLAPGSGIMGGHVGPVRKGGESVKMKVLAIDV